MQVFTAKVGHSKWIAMYTRATGKAPLNYVVLLKMHAYLDEKGKNSVMDEIVIQCSSSFHSCHDDTW